MSRQCSASLEIVGQAIAATERKQALMSDEIIELEYHVPDVLESMGVDVAADGRFTLDDVVATSDGATSCTAP